MTSDYFTIRDLPADAAIERGTCHCLFAYDIGASIDLEKALTRTVDPTQRETMPHRRRSPEYFEFKPAPLRITQPSERMAIGRFTSEAHVNCVIFDFGAVEVIYAVDIAGPIGDLTELGRVLPDHPALLSDSRRRVEDMLRRLGDAVSKPNAATLVEDYAIYHIESLRPSIGPREFVKSESMALAQLLRSESKRLSDEEMAEALGCRISYGPDDLTIIDWQASILLGRDMDDVRAVLEFANVELLEMRFLDDQLDRVLDAFNKALTQRWRPWFSVHSGQKELHRLARLQMESAVLFEEVNNALKLLGDQFLARVYRLASQRLHLPEWDASILRKLQTVESLYSKLSDFQNTRRMELLEWIIILLIAISIGIAFLPGLSH